MSTKVVQSQQSLMDQLDELEKLAVAQGLYDAHDWLRNARKRKFHITYTLSRTVVHHEGFAYHFDANGGAFVKVVNTHTGDCPNPDTHTNGLNSVLWNQIQEAAL